MAQTTRLGARTGKPDVLLALGRADTGMHFPGAAHTAASLDWEGAFDPISASFQFSSNLSLSLALMPHSGLLMSLWCPSLRLWSAQLAGCSSASPKG